MFVPIYRCGYYYIFGLQVVEDLNSRYISIVRAFFMCVFQDRVLNFKKSKKMKKILLFIVVLSFASCATSVIIPKAVNTVDAVSLRDLNLQKGDYQILNTVTAEATITYAESHNGAIQKIVGENNEFSLRYETTKRGRYCIHSGVVKLGYLSNDYDLNTSIHELTPEDVARRLAIYRLINQVMQYGADGAIEPVISTNIEQRGKNIIYKTAVRAKLVKLNTDN